MGMRSAIVLPCEAAKASSPRYARGVSLYLIRHGESEQNAQRVVQRPEVPLSARGREQATRLARRVAELVVARVLASDLPRAAQTAAAVAAASGAPLDFDDLLQERNFGDLRGTPYAELEVDPFAEGYAPPAGESWEVFRVRVARAWERVEAAAHETSGSLAVVTHGLVLRVLLETHLRRPEHLAIPEKWSNACMTVAERSAGDWHVTLVACAAHLDGLDTGDPSAGRV